MVPGPHGSLPGQDPALPQGGRRRPGSKLGGPARLFGREDASRSTDFHSPHLNRGAFLLFSSHYPTTYWKAF